MIIQYFSDCHLEFYPVEQVKSLAGSIDVKGDVLVLSGDIGNPLKTDNHYEIFLSILSAKFPMIFIIPGNHEYYGCNSMIEAQGQLARICGKFSNIHLLLDSWVDFGGFRWIGTTLWSKVDKKTGYFINDTKCIPDMTIEMYNSLHKTSRLFLRKALAVSKLKCIVITHHIPSYKLIHPRFLTRNIIPYNQWFASNLNGLILENSDKIAGWFYGHTHEGGDTELSGVEFHCNPIGYPGENSFYCYEKNTIIN